MFIRKVVSAAALGGVLVFCATDPALAGITKEGPFMAINLDDDLAPADQLAVVDGWEAHVGGLIADADDTNDIAALSALKIAIADFRTDVSREHYMHAERIKNATEAEAVASESIDADTGSHPTPTGDASISLSSQQHGVASEVTEEITNDEAHQQAEHHPRKRQRR